MAVTRTGTELTELHRQAQIQNQHDFLLEFITLWSLLDTARLDDTAPGWIQAVWRTIREYRARSADMSLRYYARFRQAEAPIASPALVLPRIEVPRSVDEPIPASSPERARLAPVIGRATTTNPPARRTPTASTGSSVDRRAAQQPTRNTPRPDTSQAAASDSRRARTDIPDPAPQERRRATIYIPDITFEREDRAAKVSLEVTGPVNQKSKTGRGKPVVTVRDESFQDAAGSAGRHVLTGGRKSLLTVLEHDPIVFGWARVTDGDPCAFCAMLASRGVVYGSQAQAGFSAHDHCTCTAEPAYSRSAPLPGRGQEFKDLWNANIRGKYSGAEARRAWRRLYEQMQRDQQRGVA